MSSVPFKLQMPIYDCWEYAMGCREFILRGDNETEVFRMADKLLETIPETSVLRIYPMGIRPDHPVPVAKYFIECQVDDDPAWGISLYPINIHGKLKHEETTI